MNKNIYVPLFLLILLLAWVLISITRTAFNLSKIVTEERQWYGLTDDQKRVLEFGDVHYFLRFVQNHTKTGTITLFITNDNEAYYLSRYYLYPSEIIRPNQPGLWNPQNNGYKYYLVYPANQSKVLKIAQQYLKKNKAKLLATYWGENGQEGLIYTK